MFSATLDVEGNPQTRLIGKAAMVTVSGYEGSIHIDYRLKKKNSSTEIVVISVGWGEKNFELYNGPIKGLLSKRGQSAIVRKFAHAQLNEVYSGED